MSYKVIRDHGVSPYRRAGKVLAVGDADTEDTIRLTTAKQLVGLGLLAPTSADADQPDDGFPDRQRGRFDLRRAGNGPEDPGDRALRQVMDYRSDRPEDTADRYRDFHRAQAEGDAERNQAEPGVRVQARTDPTMPPGVHRGEVASYPEGVNVGEYRTAGQVAVPKRSDAAPGDAPAGVNVGGDIPRYGPEGAPSATFTRPVGTVGDALRAAGIGNLGGEANVRHQQLTDSDPNAGGDGTVTGTAADGTANPAPNANATTGEAETATGANGGDADATTANEGGDASTSADKVLPGESVTTEGGKARTTRTRTPAKAAKGKGK